MKEPARSSESMFDRMRDVVKRVPRGRVTTYGDVARAAGYPTGSRQAAWCLKKFDPALPWHRVIGKGGKILLRGEGGVEQIQRLEAEGVAVAGTRVDLQEFGYQVRLSRRKKT
ncbi:MAG TPA: MGMT family protein [Bryobacteraceae bacterium]|nr:MGMT family protein [Bryobacteraceae bacterium]